MYDIALVVHSWLRWVVLLAGVLVIIRSFTRSANKNPIDATDKKLGIVFISSFDFQFLLGLLLYFVWSPVVQEALQMGGGMMKDSTLRFWAVEHISLMFLAVIVAHVGRVFAKRASSNALQHRWFAVSALVSLVLVAASIPWPFLAHGRPLFRF